MTMSVDSPASAAAAKKMQVETEMWISPDVPGWQSLPTFHQENAISFSEMVDRLATANGIPVLEVVCMKSSGVFETTLESSNFSTGGIPDSVFAIPAGSSKK